MGGVGGIAPTVLWNQAVMAHIAEKGPSVVATDIDSGYSTVDRVSYGRIDFQVLEVRVD